MTHHPESTRSRSVASQGPPSARAVLVVDDAATVRAYHRSILTEAGFEVREAANGYEAYELAVAEPFRLLVVDINMPVMDGYSLVDVVRREARTPAVPIIMVSTEREQVDSDEAYRRGANLYLVKPVDPAQLALTARILTGGLPATAADPSTGGPS